MRQERKYNILPIVLDCRGQKFFEFCKGFAQDVLSDVTFQHIVNVVYQFNDFFQRGLVVEAANGVMRKLLCRNL